MTTTLVPTNGSRLARFLTDDWPFPQMFEGLRTFEPQIRVEEKIDGDTLVVRAETPGIDPDKDVEITVTDGVLRISVERKAESTTETDGSHRSEFRYGSLVRTLRLPAGTKSDEVKASYKDGILEIRIPTAGPDSAMKKVPIDRS